MDASAKEAVKVAMDGNGYAMDLGSEESMQMRAHGGDRYPAHHAHGRRGWTIRLLCLVR